MGDGRAQDRRFRVMDGYRGYVRLAVDRPKAFAVYRRDAVIRFGWFAAFWVGLGLLVWWTLKWSLVVALVLYVGLGLGIYVVGREVVRLWGRRAVG